MLVETRLLETWDIESIVDSKDSLRTFITLVIVKVSGEDAQNRMDVSLRMKCVDDAITRPMIFQFPDFQSPQVATFILLLYPFRDPVAFNMVLPKTMHRERFENGAIVLGLLEQCFYLRGGLWVSFPYPRQIRHGITMEANGHYNTY